MRGDDARNIRLCDLFLRDCPTLLPDRPKALGIVVGQGKTNQVWQMWMPTSCCIGDALLLLYLINTYSDIF